jgi:hypothetical protein
MDGEGRRQSQRHRRRQLQAGHPLADLAGEQGLADAWYALSRIYLKPEFSQRSVAEAQAYLERAAEMGHRGAQLECGMYAWRNRRAERASDVRAAYWLQKAAAQGCEGGGGAARIAAAPAKRAGSPADRRLAGDANWRKASRCWRPAWNWLRLFGLSRAEALLLDVKAADQGHCLVVDIRASYGRSKRRLVLVRTARERQALDRIVRLFEKIDSGPDGLEGNYRQRLYRLKTWLPDGAGVAGRRWPPDARAVYNSISPSNTVTAGPVSHTGWPSPAQADRQLAAARVDRTGAVEQAAADAGHHRRAGAGAAGQRFAGAALEHAQLDVVAVEHLHEAGVDALREARMVLDQRTGQPPARCRRRRPPAPRADCPSTPPKSARSAGAAQFQHQRPQVSRLAARRAGRRRRTARAPAPAPARPCPP